MIHANWKLYWSKIILDHKRYEAVLKKQQTKHIICLTCKHIKKVTVADDDLKYI